MYLYSVTWDIIRPIGVFAALLVCTPLLAVGQTANVRGLVTDQEDGQPLQDVNLVLIDQAGTVLGTTTDGDGFFTFTRVPLGRYLFRISFVGYEAVQDSLTLNRAGSLFFTIALKPDETVLEEVLVEEEQEGVARILGGAQTIKASDIELVPAPDVSGDLVNYLVTLPGVVTLGDRGGQLFIRGGEPSHNLVQLDGMLVHQPFHVLSFFSAFPADIIGRAEVYAGGYGSKYAGRVASALDIYTRNGNKKWLAGAVSATPFVTTARLEGPLIKNRVSFLGSIRESVLEQVGARYIDAPLPYDFGDLFGKVHALLDQHNQLSFSYLQTHDRGTVAHEAADQAASEVRWTNRAYGFRYLIVPRTLLASAELLFSISKLKNELGPRGQPVRRSDFTNFNAAIHVTTYTRGSQQVHWGGMFRSYQYDFELGGLYQNLFGDVGRVTKAAFYIEPDLRIRDRLRIQAGVAMQIAAQSITLDTIPEPNQLFAYFRLRQTHKKLFEPRLRLSWEAGPHAISVAGGRYHQEIVGLNDRRDATSVFNVWTGTPSGSLTRATHVLLGYRWTPSARLAVSVEGYYRRMTDLFVSEWTPFPRLTTNLQSATGNALGLDARAEVRHPRFYGFLTYGLASVRYTMRQPTLGVWYGSETLTFRPPHDRRHQLNLLAGTRIRGVEVRLRWAFGTGLPYSRPQGFDAFLVVDKEVDVFADIARERVIYGLPNNARLPAYHRLDITVERGWHWQGLSFIAQAGVINVYNRRNVFAFDIFTQDRVDQLPVLPTLGVKAEF